ncbi:MAG: PspA/IM30 family protein [Myxococcales bacterium]|nr:PspA/IM30 family protein [Myxococcales bacterium]
MSVLKRLATLVKSNLNDLVDSMQDPAKEFDQLVRDMEDSARAARQEVAACLATEKRMVKQSETLAAEVRSWEEKAERAVKSQDDELARQALARKAEKEREKAEADRAADEQRLHVDQLTAGLKALETRVKDVKLRQGTLREQARASKGQSAVSSSGGAFAEFDRLAGRVDALEVEAHLDDELTGRTPESRAAERKLDTMADAQKLDDALAALKKKLES